MRVAIDGRQLQDDEGGGVARYLANIIPFLVAHHELEIVVLSTPAGHLHHWTWTRLP